MRKKIHISLFIVLLSFLFSNSRVAFTRPGAFIRSSTYEAYNADKLFAISLGSEVTSFGDISSHSSSFAINKQNMNGTSWGLSYTALPYAGINPDSVGVNLDYEVGAHFQSNIYNTGASNITFGVHDVLLNAEKVIALNDLSIFINFSNTLAINDYSLLTLLGLGSGKLAFDPHTKHGSASGLGVYAAMKLKTPFLNQWGGMDIMTEFLHSGLNIGLAIPFGTDYKFSFGITHIENLADLSSQSSLVPEPLKKDSPALCFGLEISVPNIRTKKERKVALDYPILFINGRVDSSLFKAGQYIYFLQDSMALLKQNINTISGQNTELQLKNQFYQDSLNSLILDSKVNLSNHNKSMRYLSKSLRLYYQGDFKQALIEVDQAIALQPNTAIAYARKGSIYYKLNQLDRATLNWNVALKLDPEYTEVRDMLNALKDNKLRPLSTN